MKPILVIFLGSCLLLNGYSQVYHPFPEDSVSWFETYDSSPDMCNYTIHDYFFTDGQAIIGGKTYTRVLLNQNFSGDNSDKHCMGPAQSENILNGFLRNDTINKRVYWYDTNYYHQEFILYDFDVAVGDTIAPNPALYLTDWYDTIVVTGFDSVDIGGAYRRSYTTLNSWGFVDTIIEGVGSTMGLIRSPFCPTCVLLCYRYANYQYPGTPGLECSFYIGLEAQNPKPNDIIRWVEENQYYVFNDENRSITITCYEIQGKAVDKVVFHQSGYLSFSHLSTGPYLMYIEYEGHLLKPLKFMVQH